MTGDPIVRRQKVLLLLSVVGGGILLLCIAGLGAAMSESTPKTDAAVSSEKWFEGGNLHKATIAQWKTATYRNKLATASDWLGASKWKGHLKSPRDFDRLKAKAEKLVVEVDAGVAEFDSMKASDLSLTNLVAMILTLSDDDALSDDDLGP